MKVKITGHSDPIGVTKWWYADRIGEVFEAEKDEEMTKYFYTMIEFKEKPTKHHIKKVDCEVIE